MSKLYIPRDEQIKMLRNTAATLRNAINAVVDARFDEDLIDIALDLRGGVNDLLSDSMIDTLQTDAESDDVIRQILEDDKFGTYEQQRDAEYNSGRL